MKNVIRYYFVTLFLAVGMLFLSPQYRVFADGFDGEPEQILSNDTGENESDVISGEETIPENVSLPADSVDSFNSDNTDNNSNSEEILETNTPESDVTEGNEEKNDASIPEVIEGADRETVGLDADGSDSQENTVPEDLEKTDQEVSELPETTEEDTVTEVPEGSSEPALLSRNASFVSMEKTPDEETSETEYIEGVAYIRGASSSYKDIPVYYHYSDSFFEDCEEVQEDGTVLENAYIYSEPLSTMSSVMSSASEMSKFSLDGEPDSKYLYMSRNIEDMMRQLGFENIAINDAYQSEIKIETIMLSAGKKTVTYGGKEYTLIALFPDSGTTDAEWPVNVELGDGEYHEGFEYGARDVLLPFLKNYIETNEITGDVKLWISGMSRAAGFVNTATGLLDFAIDDGTVSSFLTDGVNIEKKNIYVYTYGCPATVSKALVWNMDADGSYVSRKQEFNHIHNFLNGFDIIIHAVAEEWDMDRFGQPHINSAHVSGLAEDQDDFYEHVQDFCRQYVHISGTDPSDLTYGRDAMRYDEETGLYEFLGSDFRMSATDDDLEVFSRRFMKEIAPLIPRHYYKTYIQPAMELFFATGYYQTTELKEAVSEEADRYVAEMQDTVKELFLKGLFSFDFSELIAYIDHDVNPAHSIPQILINAFRSMNTSYHYDFDHHRYDDALLIDENMHQVIWHAMKQAGLGALDLMFRLRQRDIMTAIDIYQAYQAGYDALESGHNMTLNIAWTRAYDEETRSISDIYDIDMAPEDAWGYRMLNLPLNADYRVKVFDEDTDELIYTFDMVDGKPEQAAHLVKNWFVHLGTGNKGIGKVLYLPCGHNYVVEFMAIAGESRIGFSVDEWSSHYYRDTFRPVNHIDCDTSDGTPFSDLVICSDAAHTASVRLHVGALKSYPKMGESNVAESARVSPVAASVMEPVQALADYTLEKITEMLAATSLNGAAGIPQSIAGTREETSRSAAQEDKASHVLETPSVREDTLLAESDYAARFLQNSVQKNTEKQEDVRVNLTPASAAQGSKTAVSAVGRTNDSTAATETVKDSHAVSERRTAVPNTSDESSVWLALLLSFLLTACGAWNALKHSA